MIRGRVQTAGLSGSAITTIAPAFANPTTKGNVILVIHTSNTGTSNEITGVTDTQSNSYARIVSNSDATNNLDVWYAWNIAGGADTVTVNFSSAGVTVLIVELAGLASDSNPLDKSASAAGTLSPDSSGSTSATAVNNELVIGLIGTNSAGWTSYSLGTGFSNLLTQANGGIRPAIGIEDMRVDTIGTQAATFVTAATNASVITAVATFKLAPGPSFRAQAIRPHPFSPGLAR